MNDSGAKTFTTLRGVACRSRGLRDFALRPLMLMRLFEMHHVSADVIAGVTVAAVAIPQAIAYASIAELPPQVGLYAAAVAAIVGALWGCSRHLATGPVNATSLLVLPVLLSTATPGTPEFLVAASLIAIMAGVLNLILATLRFGALVTVASRSVLIGFATGAAVHIACGQMKHIFGLDIAATPELFHTVAALTERLHLAHQPSLLIGFASMVGVALLRRLGPRVPSSLMVIVGTAVAAAIFDFEGMGVRVVGSIPRSLPPLTWAAAGLWPDLHMIRTVATGAMAVAALGLIEAVAASQSLARTSGDRLDSNQEFFGQGMANLAAGVFSGYPVSGSFTRSALAQQAGGRSHLTGVVTGVTILIGMFAFAPWARFIPRPAIAGVLLVVAWEMIDRGGIARVLRTSRSETTIMTATFVATLALSLDFAVLAGVLFSLAFFVIRSSLPRVVPVVPDDSFGHLVEKPEAPVCPQLGILNIQGPLFFGAVYHIEEELRHNYESHPGQIFLILRMHGVNICDLSGVEMLEATVRNYRDLGGDVFLVKPSQPVMQTMEQSGFIDDTLGRDHILSQESAIEDIFDEYLDPIVCVYECTHRIFAECQALEQHRYDTDFPPMIRHTHEHELHVAPKIFRRLSREANSLVLDLREPGEFNHGHLPFAGLLPLRLLPGRIDELPRDRTLLLYCRSGRRTARALHILQDAGLQNVFGLHGGLLAWRAADLPYTEAGGADDEPPVQFPALPDEMIEEREGFADRRRRRRIEQLKDRLEILGRTDDIGQLRSSIESLLDQRSEHPAQDGGCLTLDPERPVLIVSDSHAMRGAFYKLLQDKYIGDTTNLESVLRGHLQVLMLGDLLHSESRTSWQAIEDEYVIENTSRGGPATGKTPATDREMCNSFGLAAMVLALQKATPGVHCLKGNHDNLLNSDEVGNSPQSKFMPWPGEGEVTRLWAEQRLGRAFCGKYSAWENGLPLLAIYDNDGDGLPFIASHSEPAEPYTLDQIRDRGDEVVYGLTWTRNRGLHAPEMLRRILGSKKLQAKYFVGHTASTDGMDILERQRLVIIAKPRHLVAALVRPTSREFDVHIIAGP